MIEITVDAVGHYAGAFTGSVLYYTVHINSMMAYHALVLDKQQGQLFLDLVCTTDLLRH